MNKQYNKIGVIRIDKVGDLLLTTPALKSIKQQWPNSKTILISSHQNSHILRNSELVDKIITYDKKINFFSKIKFLIQLRNENLDLCLVFSPINAAYFLCYFSKAKTKAALVFNSRYKKKIAKYSYRLLPHLLTPLFCNYYLRVERNTEKIVHHSLTMIELLKKVYSGFNANSFKIELSFNHELCTNLLNKFENKFENIITLHISKRWINNNYDIDNLVMLIKKLKDFNKIFFILTTDLNDKEIKNEILKKNSLNVLSFNLFQKEEININNNMIVLDELNFEELKSVIYISNLTITPHTAVTHIAAAANNVIFDIHDDKVSSEKMYKEYGPIFSNSVFFNFSSKNKLNELILSKLKLYKNLQ